jgi:hypothetical protein
MRRAALSLALVGSTACASLEPTTSVRPIDRDLLVGGMAQTTRFESEGKQQADDRGLGGQPDRSAKGQRARTGVFWAGIAMLGVGGASAVSLAIAGEVSQRQLDKGYEEGDLTRERDSTLRDRGELTNKLSIAAVTIGIVGLAMAAIAYGLDYSNCGTLAKRRKGCGDKSKRAGAKR